MKKKLFMVLVALFMFMPFCKAEALELTQSLIDNACNNTPDTDIGGVVCHIEGGDREITLLSGTYSLSEDIEAYIFNFFAEGNSILNLNDHTLTGEVVAGYGNSLTINGPGTVTGNVCAEEGNITINGGTYNEGVYVLLGKLIITDGTINSGSRPIAAGVMDGSEAIISGGTFNGNVAGFAVSKDAGIENVKSLKISGGTFTGGVTGLMIYSDDVDSVQLTGGTYNGTESGIAAITEDATKANTALTDILASGYVYSPNATANPTDMGGLFYVTLDQLEVTVVQDTNSTTTPEETTTVDSSIVKTTNNPATGDSLFVYIIIVVLSLMGLVSVKFIKQN